jgi:chorismate mutase
MDGRNLREGSSNRWLRHQPADCTWRKKSPSLNGITQTAVEDPPREEHVIASAVSEGKTEGVDPAVVSRFFRAQIEANKVARSSLLSTWHRAGKAPDNQAKDLATTIRPQLDEIQKQLIEELVSTAPVRASSTCRLDLATAVSGYLTTHQLSAVDLQATALKQSLAAFCP